MEKSQYDIGIIGLGVMGRNLALNMADHGYLVAGYDRDLQKAALLNGETATGNPKPFTDARQMLSSLRKPRAIMLLVPPGNTVDQVICELSPHLERDDVILDGGNSHYRDTERRQRALLQSKIKLLGLGISGGEAGARQGPSLMPGGDPAAYAHVRPILEACAARVNGEPCVSYLGPSACGHYVKMIHNGIEYGVMQLIAETYDLAHRGLGLGDDALSRLYQCWNESELESFLLEITANIFRQRDKETGKPLIDEVLDAARQKGTGRWTCQDAMDLGVPIPVLDASVSSRHLSQEKENRAAWAKRLGGTGQYEGNPEHFALLLRDAYYAAALITHSQALSLLSAASAAYEYNLPVETVLRIWRGGCIIRSRLLDLFRQSFRAKPEIQNPLLDELIGEEIRGCVMGLRKVVATAANLGIPVPALAAALFYFDGFRSAWLPANLIQAQRDYFGSHTFERTDKPGVFHEEWKR